MKKRLWQLHSWLGLACGLALVVIGLSGSILVFHKEIARTAFADVVMTNAPEGAERLPLPQLVETVRERFPDFWISGWLPNRSADERDLAYMKRHGDDQWHKLRVDQYSGETKTQPLAYNDTLDGWLVALHYTFFADHVGMALTAIFALGFIALSVTGVWIYRNFWKNLFRLRWRTSARIFFSDLHKTIGISSVPLNLLLGFTGAYWNIAHLVEEAGEHDHVEEKLMKPLLTGLPLDQLMQQAKAEWPYYQLNYIYFPTVQDNNVYFYGYNPSDSPLHSPYGSWMGVNAVTGEIGVKNDLREAGLWANVVDAFEPLHFGDFGGLLSKTIWCLAGLAPGILAVSGSIIFFSRRRKNRRAAAAQPQERELAEV